MIKTGSFKPYKRLLPSCIFMLARWGLFPCKSLLNFKLVGSLRIGMYMVNPGDIYLFHLSRPYRFSFSTSYWLLYV